MAKFDLARKHLDECRDYYLAKVSAGFRNALLQSLLFMVLGAALAIFFVFSYWIGAHGV